ncbi:hypothetical protein [Paenibacillus sp.]|uniref:hypothetical protein n=1 Tax=Paenibacillus sp. TaxID=58172 RepID=UPI0028A66D04|nr:hypothetical protein [Paenibacillus sp.]
MRLVRIGFFDSGIGRQKVKAVVIVLIKRKQLNSDEGKFGTVGAIATAFVSRFQPFHLVKSKKSGDNSGRKSKHSRSYD